MTDSKPIRVWIDGCFDMCHFGHANAMRQAKALGDELIVGVHSDAEIKRHKGPPVFYEKERYDMVRAIKWVDQVIEDAPYVTTVEELDQHNIDFCAHGDDITTDENGVDTYRLVKTAGRYKEFERTQGVSTTDLVGRMLLLTKTHHQRREGGSRTSSETLSDAAATAEAAQAEASPYSGFSQFLTTTRKMMQFCDGKAPKTTDRIVYVDGSFDLFHVGHVRFLERAAALGDFVIVGLHSDADVNAYAGSNFPIMNINERVLCTLACRYVNEIVIGAPVVVSSELLDHFRISLVVRGLRSDDDEDEVENGEVDPYAEPRRRGIYRTIVTGCSMSQQTIIERVIQHRLSYEERNKKKQMKELRVLEAMAKRSAALADQPTNQAV